MQGSQPGEQGESEEERGAACGGVCETLGAQRGWGRGTGEAVRGLGDPEQFSDP